MKNKLITLLINLFYTLVGAQELDFKIDTLIYGDLVQPWGVAFIDEENALITEKSGKLIHYNKGNYRFIEGLPKIDDYGQGGLLDIITHPNYINNRMIYFTAVIKENDLNIYRTALFEALYDSSKIKNVKMIFAANNKSDSGAHFGSRIVIDSSNYIYFSLGDRGEMNSAQDLSNNNGSIIRLNINGEIPVDNPFFNNENINPEIWSYGHRNVQGLAIDPMTNDLWAHEHGPKGGDELNRIKRGANYGWPLATYGINYDGSIITSDTTIEGAEDPVYYWVPSIAPCGMNFYVSDKIKSFQNSLFIGALAGKHIVQIKLFDKKVLSERKLLEGTARFRQVIQGPDGFLYFVTENPGMFGRLIPKENRPSKFQWISNQIDSIFISKENIEDSYTFKWTESEDLDDDIIKYILYAQVGVYIQQKHWNTTSTEFQISYEALLETVFEDKPFNTATVKFSVFATDGLDTIKISGDDRVLYVNRYDYLSTLNEGVPDKFALHENYPNPFNPSTTLRFDLPEVRDLTITIYNMIGQKVKTFNMQSTPAGYHAVKWNATNDYGDPVGAGVYLYQLQTKDFVKTRKMVLLK